MAKEIVAKGIITSVPFPAHHPTVPQKMTPHATIKITEIRPEAVPFSALEQAYSAQTWNPRQSGILIKLEAVERLELPWR